MRAMNCVSYIRIASDVMMSDVSHTAAVSILAAITTLLSITQATPVQTLAVVTRKLEPLALHLPCIHNTHYMHTKPTGGASSQEGDNHQGEPPHREGDNHQVAAPHREGDNHQVAAPHRERDNHQVAPPTYVTGTYTGAATLQ